MTRAMICCAPVVADRFISLASRTPSISQFVGIGLANHRASVSQGSLRIFDGVGGGAGSQAHCQHVNEYSRATRCALIQICMLPPSWR